MHFTGEITLGSLLSIATLIGVAVSFGQRLGRFEAILGKQAETLTEHAARMTRYEGLILSFVADLQRLVGRSEVVADRNDRYGRLGRTE